MKSGEFKIIHEHAIVKMYISTSIRNNNILLHDILFRK